MKIILLSLCLSMSLLAHENTKEYGHAYARKYAQSIKRLEDLKIKTSDSLDMLMRVSIVNLQANGYIELADQIHDEWVNQYRDSLIMDSRDIGHIFLSAWLERTYDKIEFALGVEVCKALHLSDIKTLNCALAVVFDPCDYDMTGVLESRKQDYRDHFAKGAVYYGLVPVVTYWGITAGCWIGTAGLGAFVCSIAASASEWAMGNAFAPPLSDRIFDAVCGE